MTETIELVARLRAEVDVPLGAVIVNRVLPELFTHSDEETFEALREPEASALLTERGGGRGRGARRGAPRGLVAPQRAPRTSTSCARRSSSRCSTCRTCSCAITACASRAWWPTRSARSSGNDHARAALRHEGDRGVLRFGRRRQDVGRGRRRARCGDAPRRQDPRAHDRPGAPARDRARARRHRQRGPPGAGRGAEDRRHRAARRALGRDARHEAIVGRPRAAARARRRDREPHPREPAVPQPHRALRAESRLHRDGAALRDPRVGRVRPHRRRHAAPTRNAVDFLDAPAAWRSSSAAGCCAGSRSRTASAASAACA